MDVRQLINGLITYANLDDEIKLRIVKRDENGAVTHHCVIPIHRVQSVTGPYVVVEFDEMDKVGWEPY